MAGTLVGSLAVSVPASPARLEPLQTAELAAVLGAPGPLRAVVVFVLVAAVGGLLLWRRAAFVNRSIDASRARPLTSLGYGVAAHAVIAFGGIYLTTRLAQFAVYGRNVGAIGVVAGVLLIVLAGSLGFVVVGSTLVEYGWERRPWFGLLVGALVAGGAGALDVVAGGLLWFVFVSMGIGGAARRWLHADVVQEVE